MCLIENLELAFLLKKGYFLVNIGLLMCTKCNTFPVSVAKNPWADPFKYFTDKVNR